MNLPNDIARCDGLLPKKTLLNGEEVLLWAIDCPKREQCARYRQIWRDGGAGSRLPFVAHFHAPADECPTFIAEV